MPETKKTWISILIGVLIAGIVLGVAFVGAAAVFMRGHVNTQVTSAATAGEQFTRERARFAGQQPLIDVRRGEEMVVRRPAPSAPKTRLHTVRAIAYDARTGKLVTLDLPFWLLRLAPANNFSIVSGNLDLNSERVHLSLDDLERYGPGLLIDANTADGEQVLVWTE